MKRLISLLTALVLLCAAGFTAVRADALEIEIPWFDEDAAVSIVEYTGSYLFNAFCDAVRLLEILFYRFDTLAGFLNGEERKTVEVTDFAWSDAPPALAEDGASAYGCAFTLSGDINFLLPFADITAWYEYNTGGLLWHEVKTDEYFTFSRNKFTQGYLRNAQDDSIRYNNLGQNLILTAGTSVCADVSGNASNTVYSLYSLEPGTAYDIRLCLYINTGSAHLLYKSPALSCVR